MEFACLPDLQDNSNDFSVIDQLSIVVELGCYRLVNIRKI